MPYVISGNLDDNRVAGIEFDRQLTWEFFFPLARGEQPTPELLAKKPDPFIVQPPKKGRLPEIFGRGLGVWIIKESVKDIIEELEPGVHAFIPVNLRAKGYRGEWGQYYLLLPGQAIDAVVIDETDFTNGRGRSGFELDPTGLGLAPTLSPFGETVLEAGSVASHHLWRGAWGRIGESVPFSDDLFCSDELAGRIRAAGLEGWEFRSCKLKAIELGRSTAPEWYEAM